MKIKSTLISVILFASLIRVIGFDDGENHISINQISIEEPSI